MFKCAPLSLVLRMVKIGKLVVYMYKVVNNKCTHDLSLRVINHHIQFCCSARTDELVSLSLVQTMGHSHNCLHELVMAMLLFKVSISQSSQHTSENMQAYNSNKISYFVISYAKPWLISREIVKENNQYLLCQSLYSSNNVRL